MSEFDLRQLEAIIAARGRSGDPGSWTAKLFAAGREKAAQEAIETVIAAVSQDRDGVIDESADLLYHWLVVLALADVTVDEVMAKLKARTAQSGIAEKASRKS